MLTFSSPVAPAEFSKFSGVLSASLSQHHVLALMLEEKGMTEDEMVGWHHRLNGHEFGWRRKRQPTPVLLPGKSHGWRSLAGYSP